MPCGTSHMRLAVDDVDRPITTERVLLLNTIKISTVLGLRYLSTVQGVQLNLMIYGIIRFLRYF